MSRITGSEAKNLMEAYASVYAPQELTEEQIWEEVENWVKSLLEEGYDLSDYTWEEMYEAYIEENSQELGASARKVFGTARRAVGDIAGAGYQGYAGQKTTSSNPLARIANFQTRAISKPFRELGTIGKGFLTGDPGKSSSSNKPEKPGVSNIPSGTKNSPYNQKNLGGDQFKAYKAGGGDAAMAKGSGTAAEIIARGRKALTPSGSGSGGGNPPASPTQKPTPAGQGPKVNPTKPAGSAMDQWAKANPKLAAAAAEKARIRGTQQTDNPLMKDMKSKLPMNSPSVQSPAVSKLGAGNQSLSQNPNAFKAATPSKAIAAAPSTSAAASGSVAPATAALAATPKPTPVAPKAAPAGGYSTREGDGKPRKKEDILFSYQYEDAFDVVLEYLLDNGHVETVDEALYVMMEMDAEVIRDIVEEVINEGANYDKNRKRAAQRAAARNAARDAGQTGAVPGVGYVTPRRESETYRDSAGVERHKTGARMPKKD